MGKLYVVRHADAGTRGISDGPDELRELTERGRRQAIGVRDQLADVGATRLLASPFRRCMDTLQPLAEHLDIKVCPDDRLAEGNDVSRVLALAAELAAHTAVVCSHGDIIPDLLDELVQQGMKLDREVRWPKASTWVLRRDGSGFSKGTYLPPPR